MMESPLLIMSRKYHFSSGCRNQQEGKNYGYNYQLEVFFSGRALNHTGLIINLSEIDKVINPCIQLIDHKNLDLDSISGLQLNSKPESDSYLESLAQWIFQYIYSKMHDLKSQNSSLRLNKLLLKQGEFRSIKLIS